LIEVGASAPDFELPDQDGEQVTLADFSGRKLLIVFYPGDFTPVCSDQLTVYQDLRGELDEAGVTMVGISVDSFFVHQAFREKLGLETRLLSDFEPKGQVARAYGSWFEPMGFANRTLVLVDEDGKVAWTYESPSPGEFPGLEVLREALAV
jgi:peroxiredoxin